ncbi:MAG: HAMP domain-containing protein, partial [Nitrospinales bacterium]
MKGLNLGLGGKIYLMVGSLTLLMAGSLFYVFLTLGESTVAIEHQRRSLSHLDLVSSTYQTFAEMRYWLVDLTVSWQNESEENAMTAKEELNKLFLRLQKKDKDLVLSLQPKVDSFVDTMMKSVDAYVEENRVLGNSLVAEGRNDSGFIEEALIKLLARAQAEANEQGSKVVAGNIWIRNMALLLMVFAVVAGSILSFLFARSITGPLKEVSWKTEELGKGQLKQEAINIQSRDEIGSMGRTFNVLISSLQKYIGHSERILAGDITSQKLEVEGDFKQSLEKMLSKAKEKIEIEKKNEEQTEELRNKVDALLGV